MTTPATNSAPDRPSPLVAEVRKGLRRTWPVLSLIGFLAYFDWTLNGNLFVTLVLALLAYAPSLFAARLQPMFAQIKDAVPLPAGVQRIAAVGGPLALLYLTRWRGTQSIGAAFGTIAIPLGLALIATTRRAELAKRLAPFYEARNRILPRGARLALVFVVAILATFIFAHGSLSDLPALLGGRTSSPRRVGDSNLGIVFSALFSAVAAFLLLDDPTSEETS